MKKSLPLSEEMLAAYVDGEIDGDELEHIIAMEKNDKALAATICEMRKLKNLVKAARAPEPEYNSSYIINKCKRYKYIYRQRKKVQTSCLAASLLMVLAITAYSYFEHRDVHNSSISESIYLDKNSLFAAASTKEDLNLVMHLKSADLSSADEFLAVLESALIKSRKNNNNLHVEVVVSGPGLHLLQKTSLTNGNKIRTLQKKYNNLTLLACGTTLQRHKNKSGKDVQIIDEAMLVASGPEWVKKRKSRGWSYFLI